MLISHQAIGLVSLPGVDSVIGQGKGILNEDKYGNTDIKEIR